jgi:hypothetical protein
MQRKTLYATDGETLKVSNQWAAETEKRGTTVSASAWEFSGSGTIASETLANGEVLIATRKVSMPVPRTLDYQ